VRAHIEEEEEEEEEEERTLRVALISTNELRKK